MRISALNTDDGQSKHNLKENNRYESETTMRQHKKAVDFNSRLSKHELKESQIYNNKFSEIKAHLNSNTL